MFLDMKNFLTNDEITEKLNGLIGWEFENDMIKNHSILKILGMQRHSF